MLRKNKDTNEILQTASTSVDIETKIYSIKVDDVHAKSLKLVNDLSKVKLALENRDKNDSGEEMDVDKNNDEDENEKNKKEKPKKRRINKNRLIIAEDDESLNAIFEKQTLIEENNYDVAAMTKVRFQMDSVDKTKFFTTLFTTKSLPNYPIRKSLRDFIVDNWDINEETFNESIQNNDNGWQIDQDPNELNETVIEDLEIQNEQNQPEPLFITDARPILADITSKQHIERTESTILSFRPLPSLQDRPWAGPKHWKWKMLRRNKENVPTNPNEPQKVKKPRKVIKPVDFGKFLSRMELMKNDFKSEKRAKNVNRKTVRVNDSIIPENLKITSNHFTRLYTNENIQVSSKQF